jgi:RimJ/RimL family protein N-acetyltransferase
MTTQNQESQLFLKSERVVLRILNQTDLPLCQKWLNDAQVIKWMLAGTYPMYLSSEEGWYKNLAESKTDVVLAIEIEGTYIGNTGLHKIDLISRVAELGLFIGLPSYWGKGYATEAEKLMIDYAFNSLNLNRIEAQIFAENLPSRRAAEKNGFQQEGISRQRRYKNGEYREVV